VSSSTGNSLSAKGERHAPILPAGTPAEEKNGHFAGRRKLSFSQSQTVRKFSHAHLHCFDKRKVKSAVTSALKHEFDVNILHEVYARPIFLGFAVGRVQKV